MEFLEAIETYLFETGQISAVAKRQARLFGRSVKDRGLEEEARAMLLLNLAALSRGAPRAPKDFLLGPLAPEFAGPLIDAYVKEHPDGRPAWEGFVRDPAIFKNAGKITDALFKNPQRFTPLSGEPPLESDCPESGRQGPLLLVGRNKKSMGFARYFYAAASLEKEMLRRLNQRSPVTVPDETIAKIIAEVFVKDSILNRDQKFHYRQVAAAALALATPLMVVSGGPGTGKTRVVIQILRLLLRAFPAIQPDRICLCAPTGRAKARLGESIEDDITRLEKNASGGETPERARDYALKNLERKTIDGLLSIRPDGSMKYTAENPLPCRVIVVDEASMVDLYRFDAMLKAAAPDCRILLVGDMHQLPSVEAGAVLGDLTHVFDAMESFPTLGRKTGQWLEKVTAHVETDGNAAAEKAAMVLPDKKTGAGPLVDHAVILTHSYRSTKGILVLSEAVNRGDSAASLRLIEECRASGVIGHLVDEGTGPVETWFRDHYTKEKLDAVVRLKRIDLDSVNDPEHRGHAETMAALGKAFKVLDESRVLTLANGGLRGRWGINRLAEKMLRPQLDPKGRNQFFHGMQIVLGVNHHDLDLFNGDTGIAVQSAGGGLKAVFRRGANFFVHALDRLTDSEPAFAMTVHKSQGSEFDEVLLVLPEYDSPLLSRQIIYTGITRAKSKIMILGSTEILKQAIENYEKRAGGIELG